MSWHTSRLPWLASPLAVWVRPCIPGTLCHFAPSGLAASCGVGTIVSNDLLSVRVQTPVTRCSMRLSTTAGRPGGGDPIYTTACWQARKFTGRLHQHQDRGVTPHRQSAYPSLSTAPSGKTPVSRKRHSAMSNLRATATIPIRLKRLPPLAEALPKPATQGTVRLKAQPTPCQLRGHPAHMPVARLGDPLFPGTLTALIRRRREAR